PRVAGNHLPRRCILQDRIATLEVGLEIGPRHHHHGSFNGVPNPGHDRVLLLSIPSTSNCTPTSFVASSCMLRGPFNPVTAHLPLVDPPRYPLKDSIFPSM